MKKTFTTIESGVTVHNAKWFQLGVPSFSEHRFSFLSAGKNDKKGEIFK